MGGERKVYVLNINDWYIVVVVLIQDWCDDRVIGGIWSTTHIHIDLIIEFSIVDLVIVGIIIVFIPIEIILIRPEADYRKREWAEN